MFLSLGATRYSTAASQGPGSEAVLRVLVREVWVSGVFPLDLSGAGPSSQAHHRYHGRQPHSPQDIRLTQELARVITIPHSVVDFSFSDAPNCRSLLAPSYTAQYLGTLLLLYVLKLVAAIDLICMMFIIPNVCISNSDETIGRYR